MQVIPLDKFRSNVYSQNGEDGVLRELLNRLDSPAAPCARWCVEFGAWDGKLYSNTFNLVRAGWRAVYIEGDEKRYGDLLKTAQENPAIVPVNCFVGQYASDKNSLDAILATTPVPKNFDLLSIDIDSYDLDVWESLQNYSANIVVIEVDSRYRVGVEKRYPQATDGNSFTSTLKSFMARGYSLVAHTGNMIFVKNTLITEKVIEERYLKNPALLFDSHWVKKNFWQKMLCCG